jgi:hypothetical protein
MRLVKVLIFGLSLSAVAGLGFAGEDTTHKWHCTGVNYYDNNTGLQNFNPAYAECGATVHE